MRNKKAAPVMGPRVADLTGQRFGSLTVVSYAGKDKRSQATWLCKCDCGRPDCKGESAVAAGNLKNDEINSCGAQAADLTGQRYGSLTVVSFAGISKGTATWLCKCDCGKPGCKGENTVAAGRLKSGNTKSCGARGIWYEVAGMAVTLREAARVSGRSIETARRKLQLATPEAIERRLKDGPPVMADEEDE